MINDKKLEFWNARSGLGEIAGSNDFILKRIETKLILERIRPHSSVLDIGCGNGDTLIQLSLKNNCNGVGIDFAPDMIKAAEAACKTARMENQLQFEVGHVPGLRPNLGEFDFVITERCLINLDDAGSQKQAFYEIMQHVMPNGVYLMIEDSLDGLEKLNAMRLMLDLEPIGVPWHNVFLRESDVARWANDHCLMEEFIPFTSTYYFLSRVIYARLARDKGEELRYDSDINMLAPILPSIGDIGAVRLWVWRRKNRLI